MRKILPVLLVPLVLISAVLISIPVFAQAPRTIEECKISKRMEAGQWAVIKGQSTFFALYRDNNRDGAFSDPDEMLPHAIYPNSPGVRDLSLITIPHSAEANGTGAWDDIRQGNTLPPNWAIFCLVNIVNTLTDWAFFILSSIAFVFVLIAGFLWTTSGSDAEKQKNAGKMIFAALVGLVIAILSRAIPAVITGLLT